MPPRFIPTIRPCRLPPWTLPSFALSLVRVLHCPFMLSYGNQTMVCLAFIPHALKSLAKPVYHGIGISFYFKNVTKFRIDTSRWFHGAWQRDHLCDLWVLDAVVTNQRTAHLNTCVMKCCLAIREPYIGCPNPCPCPNPPMPMGFRWAWVRCYYHGWAWVGIASKWVHNPCPSILLETWTWTCMSCQYIEFNNYSCLLYVLSL